MPIVPNCLEFKYAWTYSLVLFSNDNPRPQLEDCFLLRGSLVGEDNAPLLTDDDKDVIKNASVLPIFRLFNTVLGSQSNFDTAKKN